MNSVLSEQSVIDEVKAIIEAITDDDDNLVFKQVLDYIPAQWTRFPAVYILPNTWQEDYIDLRDTGIVATFTIGIVYTLSPNIEQGQLLLREAVTLLRSELRKQENIQLGGAVDWSQLTQGQYTFDVKEQKMALCSITLSVRKRYNRFTE